MAGSWSRGGHRPEPEVCLWQPQAGGSTRWQGRVSPMVCSSFGAFGLELSKKVLPNKDPDQDTLHHVMLCLSYCNLCVHVCVLVLCVCGSVSVRGFGSSSRKLERPTPSFSLPHPPALIQRRCSRCRVKDWWNQFGGLAPSLVKAAGGLAYEPLSLLG